MANGYLIRNGTGMTNVSFVANPTVGSRIWVSSKQYTTIAYGNTYNAAYRYGNGIGDIRYQNYSIAAPGSRTFTSSGTFTVPNGVTQIRIFCVGGGGGGGHSGTYVRDEPFKQCASSAGGGGGGGAYTTSTTLAVSPGQQISITIGAGGSVGSYERTTDSGQTTASWRKVVGFAGTSGGTTKCGSVSAAGGNGGGGGTPGTGPSSSNLTSGTGGYGGSGYANGGKGGDPATLSSQNSGGDGGAGVTYNNSVYSGGGAGAEGGWEPNDGDSDPAYYGEPGTPGGAGGVSGEDATANTGGGGGANGNGGSGICIISWG